MKIRKILSLLLLITAVSISFESCSNDDGEDPSSNKVIKLSSTNLTEDGYFDGIMYYKIISNITNEIGVNRCEKSAETIEIPSEVIIDGVKYKCTSISEEAFCDCDKLVTITIPPTIRKSGHRAFFNCTSLKTVNIYDWNAWFNIEFDKIASNPLCQGCNLIVSGNVIQGEIIIPNNVTSLQYTFTGIQNITSVIIPNSVTMIKGAFWQCSHLSKITIPSSVTEIRDRSFEECKELKEIHCKCLTPPYLTNDSFRYTEVLNTATLYIPKGTFDSYNSSDVWKSFINKKEE